MDRYLYICGQFTRCFKSDDGKKKKTQQPFQCSTLDEHNWHANETQQEGFQPNIMQKHLSLIAEFRQALAHSPFLFFPSEVVLHIFCFLSVYDLANTSLVCRLFKVLVDRDDLWKLKCDTSIRLHSKSFKQIYIEWVYEKRRRSKEIEMVEAIYRSKYVRTSDIRRREILQYPVRPRCRQSFSSTGGFMEHPNSSDDMDIKITVNVDKMAREFISLLEKASAVKIDWHESAIARQMITRYYRFMQLKADSSLNILLVPTLDIEIVWQTHLARPTIYRRDCLRLFGRVIDHSLLANQIEQFLKDQAFVDTCLLYEQRFGEQYCPLPSISENEKYLPKYSHPAFGQLTCLIPVYFYWDKTHFQFSSELPTDFQNPFSFTESDLTFDCNWLDRCKLFVVEMHSRVSINNYYPSLLQTIDLRLPAIGRLKKSYERFLYLLAKYPPANGCNFVHSTYAIDIIWRSHMQEPLKYAADCVHLIGRIIDYPLRLPLNEDKMKKLCNDTADYWKQEFQIDMSIDHLYNTVESSHETYND